MNKREREFFEMGLRNKISYKEEERNRIIKEGAIKDILLQLEIVKYAVQSQNPEVLKKGLVYCLLIQEIIRDLEIGYDEINSSEEKIKSLENEIVCKLPVLPSLFPNIVIIAGKDSEEEINKIGNDPFEINPN